MIRLVNHFYSKLTLSHGMAPMAPSIQVAMQVILAAVIWLFYSLTKIAEAVTYCHNGRIRRKACCRICPPGQSERPGQSWPTSGPWRGASWRKEHRGRDEPGFKRIVTD